jgi:hypothetical protein
MKNCDAQEWETRYDMAIMAELLGLSFWRLAVEQNSAVADTILDHPCATYVIPTNFSPRHSQPSFPRHRLWTDRAILFCGKPTTSTKTRAHGWLLANTSGPQTTSSRPETLFADCSAG